ncbi:hypothetical protein DICPUDRAFT_56277, partial [Dictyostelium purpureum]
SIAQTRLVEERKAWRKDHPPGFYARPETNADESLNLFKWKCGIPGKPGTPWEGGLYTVYLHFKEDYPLKAPLCFFDKGFFHINVFDNGQICLSIIGDDWKPSISIKNILTGIYDLLESPNPDSAANSEAINLWRKNKTTYTNKIKQQAIKYDAEKQIE